MAEQLSFHIAVNLTGILGMIFILMNFAFNSVLKSPKAKRLCAIMVLYIATMLADMVLCLHRGRPGAFYLLSCIISVRMALENMMLMMFVFYLRVELDIKATEWRLQFRLIVTVGAVLLFLILTNPLHQMFIVLSPQTGLIQQTGAFPLLPILSCLILGICLHQVVIRREVRMQPRLCLGFYCLIHIIALLAQPLLKGIPLVNLSSLLSMLVLYSNYHAEQNLKYSQQELELQNTRAALVLSQIQPHFLFNSMTAVMDLCDTDPKEAKAALQELSDYLHYKISALSGNFMVSFAEDMEFLLNYLKLEKRRFGDRLQVKYDIGISDFKVPLLTLQPLVENAIRHGISKRPEGGTIRITTREIAEYYSILVEDNGVGFDPSIPYHTPGAHVGLSNVRTRLAILCSGSLTVRSIPGTGTTIEITIRKEQEGNPHENTGRG